VLDFAEGSKLFPERSVYQLPKNYPALRVTPGPDHACVFYDYTHGCGIYEDRPEICRRYHCDHLTAELAKS